eukprot:gene114-167_t
MHGEVTFGLDDDRYVVMRLLGSGSFGVTIRAFDRIGNRFVAIKQIPNVFELDHTPSIITREIRILNALRSDSILSLLDVELSENSIYIITECCDTDLSKLIKSEKRINKSDYIFMMYQILHAIDFMHSSGILHRDIKPANILVNSNRTIKLCDFGLARVVENCDVFIEPNAKDLTEYVVSRWYRAPEIVLVPGRYGKAQDIWGAACTFAEMILQRPLFPGESVVHQLHVIVNVLGKPTATDLAFDMTPRARKYIESLDSSEYNLDTTLIGARFIHKDLFPLLRDMLQFNPHRRISSKEACNLPIFNEYRNRINSTKMNMQPPLSPDIGRVELAAMTTMTMRNKEEKEVNEEGSNPVQILKNEIKKIKSECLLFFKNKVNNNNTDQDKNKDKDKNKKFGQSNSSSINIKEIELDKDKDKEITKDMEAERRMLREGLEPKKNIIESTTTLNDIIVTNLNSINNDNNLLSGYKDININNRTVNNSRKRSLQLKDIPPPITCHIPTISPRPINMKRIHHIVPKTRLSKIEISDDSKNNKNNKSSFSRLPHIMISAVKSAFSGTSTATETSTSPTSHNNIIYPVKPLGKPSSNTGDPSSNTYTTTTSTNHKINNDPLNIDKDNNNCKLIKSNNINNINNIIDMKYRKQRSTTTTTATATATVSNQLLQIDWRHPRSELHYNNNNNSNYNNGIGTCTDNNNNSNKCNSDNYNNNKIKYNIKDNIKDNVRRRRKVVVSQILALDEFSRPVHSADFAIHSRRKQDSSHRNSNGNDNDKGLHGVKNPFTSDPKRGCRLMDNRRNKLLVGQYQQHQHLSLCEGDDGTNSSSIRPATQLVKLDSLGLGAHSTEVISVSGIGVNVDVDVEVPQQPPPPTGGEFFRGRRRRVAGMGMGMGMGMGVNRLVAAPAADPQQQQQQQQLHKETSRHDGTIGTTSTAVANVNVNVKRPLKLSSINFVSVLKSVNDVGNSLVESHLESRHRIIKSLKPSPRISTTSASASVPIKDVYSTAMSIPVQSGQGLLAIMPSNSISPQHLLSPPNYTKNIDVIEVRGYKPTYAPYGRPINAS